MDQIFTNLMLLLHFIARTLNKKLLKIRLVLVKTIHTYV